MIYYFYASAGAFDHYYVGYMVPRLEAMEAVAALDSEMEAAASDSSRVQALFELPVERLQLMQSL